MLDFNEFQKTHRVVTDQRTILNLADLDENPNEPTFKAAHMYELDCWILEFANPNAPKKYWLLIQTNEWESDELSELEETLYSQHYVHEAG